MKRKYVKLLSAVTALIIMGTTTFAGGTVIRADNVDNNIATVTEIATTEAVVINPVSGTVIEPIEDDQLEDYEKAFLEKKRKEYAELQAKVGTTETIINEDGVEQVYQWKYVNNFRCILKKGYFNEETRVELAEDMKELYKEFEIYHGHSSFEEIPNGEKIEFHEAYMGYFEDCAGYGEEFISYEEYVRIMDHIKNDPRVLWAGYTIEQVCIDHGYEMYIDDPIKHYPIEEPIPTSDTSIPTSPKTADVTTAFPWMITGSISLLVLVTLSKRKDVIE